MKTGSFINELEGRSETPLVMVRYPNWVGDAVMALPALEAVSLSMPEAKIFVLAKPWVADVVEISGLNVQLTIYEDPGGHSGISGKIRLARVLRRRQFDGAILFQNAFEAAFLAAAAGMPLRAGYSTDARRLLLTHPVPATPGRWPEAHQVGYYLDLVRALGFSAPVEETPRLGSAACAHGKSGAVILAPGASFGPAKMWPVGRYVELGRRLAAGGNNIIIIGSGSEKEICRMVKEGIGTAAEDVSGETTLKEAAAILSGAALVVCNDSGLMHIASALDVPLVALFGSTDPDATGPVSSRSLVIRGEASCAPCFRRECPRNMECFDKMDVDRVEKSCLDILEKNDKSE